MARDLLGRKIVRELNGSKISGIILETEAYLPDHDSASHAYRGKTPRNSVMFGPAGHAYIYFIYGMHYMLNIVTGAVNEPSAVLIRSLKPLDGIEMMKKFRGSSNHKSLADGPGKLCQALAISRSLNGHDLTSGSKLWLETGVDIPSDIIEASPRIGIAYALENDRGALLRFYIREVILAD